MRKFIGGSVSSGYQMYRIDDNQGRVNPRNKIRERICLGMYRKENISGYYGQISEATVDPSISLVIMDIYMEHLEECIFKKAVCI